jgi:hypothetical protein
LGKKAGRGEEGLGGVFLSVAFHHLSHYADCPLKADKTVKHRFAANMDALGAASLWNTNARWEG